MRPDKPAQALRELLGQGSPLHAIVDGFADLLADKLASRMDKPSQRYADARNNPLGSERAFLDAARRGAFESFKRGRTVAARWEDVEKYVESCKRPARRAVECAETDTDREELAKAGVRLRPGPTRARR
jgi:hypothetical protein